jgi:hypothetical protein
MYVLLFTNAFIELSERTVGYLHLSKRFPLSTSRKKDKCVHARVYTDILPAGEVSGQCF